MSATSIEWTDETWNPVTGCSKQSEGCLHCYAESMSNRLKLMGIKKYSNGFSISLHPEVLTEPLSWIKPRNIFVCSMSDLFHEKIPFEYIDKVLATIKRTPHHRYQLLTKRPERMAEFFSNRIVPDNVWVGTTVENNAYKKRMEILKTIKAKVHFLSCEPLLGPIDNMDLSDIEWVIVGGESGPKARRMDIEWVNSIHEQASKAHVPFFFKQWGTWGEDGIKRSKKANGKLLNGLIIQEMPIISK